MIWVEGLRGSGLIICVPSDPASHQRTTTTHMAASIVSPAQSNLDANDEGQFKHHADLCIGCWVLGGATANQHGQTNMGGQEADGHWHRNGTL